MSTLIPRRIKGHIVDSDLNCRFEYLSSILLPTAGSSQAGPQGLYFTFLFLISNPERLEFLVASN